LETRLQHDDTTAFVTDALLQLSSRLALCKESNTYRTIDLVQALGSHGNRNLFTYQQQDAQEFFQLVSSMITKEEILKSKPTMRDILLSENDTIPFLFDGKKRFMNDIKMSRNPFTGLLASRISCLKCGHQVIYFFIAVGLET
jgi:ubiquitin carboxyl-terminal hydrolase 1